MKVLLTRDTIVRFAGGTVLEVSEAEASRLFAFHNAVPVREKAEAKAEKKTTKKK